MGEVTMKPRHLLQGFARALRNNTTDVERLLWQYLRNSQLEGVKFRRQQPIEAYNYELAGKYMKTDLLILLLTFSIFLTGCSMAGKNYNFEPGEQAHWDLKIHNSSGLFQQKHVTKMPTRSLDLNDESVRSAPTPLTHKEERKKEKCEKSP